MTDESESRSGSRSRTRSRSPLSVSPISSSSSYGETEEVDQLLENALEGSNEDNIQRPIERLKTVLKKRGQDHFEVLPEGWLAVTHSSGMPLYLHKPTRVCTMSKPYFLGAGSARKHEIPLSAIPCLHYRREKQKEEELKEASETNNVTVGLETVQDYKRDKWLSATDVREYCERLFEFVEIKVRKFKTWADRRKHNAIIREQRQRPSLPNDTRLITCRDADGKKAFVMNPAGKSAVCLLHEFVQHKEKVQPSYKYAELHGSAKPYSATVKIKETLYGTGYGKSKKDAKEEAARLTALMFCPGLKDFTSTKSGQEESSQQDLLEFFDNIKIDDDRVEKLCSEAGVQSPFQILVEWKKRNAEHDEIKCEAPVATKHHKNIYIMKVKEHEARVEGKNRREGKQRAAQMLLKKLHPQVSCWGGLLRMYGRGSCKTPKEKKEEEQQITELQSTASPNTPNYAILNKLREEMSKLS